MGQSSNKFLSSTDRNSDHNEVSGRVHGFWARGIAWCSDWNFVRLTESDDDGIASLWGSDSN
jgi:hypothetical protein